ncbi:13803_t:CDS:1, partial [Entrophospora sp. SA101]
AIEASEASPSPSIHPKEIATPPPNFLIEKFINSKSSTITIYKKEEGRRN